MLIYLERILTMFPIVPFNNVLAETEISKPFNSRILLKKGLPQGASFSPILAVMVINEAFNKVNLKPIMYADDGVILTEQKINPFLGKEGELRKFGIVLSKKPKKDGSDACKFTEKLNFSRDRKSVV